MKNQTVLVLSDSGFQTVVPTAEGHRILGMRGGGRWFLGRLMNSGGFWVFLLNEERGNERKWESRERKKRGKMAKNENFGFLYLGEMVRFEWSGSACFSRSGPRPAHLVTGCLTRLHTADFYRVR